MTAPSKTALRRGELRPRDAQTSDAAGKKGTTTGEPEEVLLFGAAERARKRQVIKNARS